MSMVIRETFGYLSIQDKMDNTLALMMGIFSGGFCTTSRISRTKKTREETR
jgi:hypothetical protein